MGATVEHGPGRQELAQATQDETDLDQTAVGTLTSVLGNARVNTVRLARTWEHWWHGNECFRAQGPNGGQAGFDFGNEPLGNQSLCPPQLSYLEFLAQASTEAQGPWDSNYQIEDDYSWFRPGTHGDHDMKFGFRYNYTALRRVSQVNENGTFTFNTNLAFDPANPGTYPERFSIRTGAFEENVKNHTYELYAQDKWRVRPQTTINVGIRYDLEIIPLDEAGNPLFSPGQSAPTDKNNISPRLSFTHSLDASGKSVIRGGYGIFYNRTILGAVDDTLEFGKFTSSNVVTFPANSADPGRARGGSRPTRTWSTDHSSTAPFSIRRTRRPGGAEQRGRDLRLSEPDAALRAPVHAGVRTRAQAVARPPRRLRPGDQQGHVPGAQPQSGAPREHEPYRRADAIGRLWRAGRVLYSAGLGDGERRRLGLQRAGLLAREALLEQVVGPDLYSLSKAIGTGNDQADKNLYQAMTNANLDLWRGPSNVDRRHILSLGAQVEIPKTGGVTLSSTARYMSGAPFTIFDSGIDADRNGELVDPVPAGTYSGPSSNPNAMQSVTYAGGRNGAVGPDYFQLDLRAGWRRRINTNKALEVFLDIFNVTDRANFDNPTTTNSDRRFPDSFLVLTNLRGGGGFPRQAEMGFRLVF